MDTLNALTKLAIDFRNARDWGKFHKPKDVALSLSLEAAELLEHFQWKDDEEVKSHVAAHKDEIGEELSDILYWVLTMAHDLGIDLSAAFAAKMAKNEMKYPVQKCFGKNTKYSEL